MIPYAAAFDLSERSTAPELMDDLRIGGSELARALQQLRLINWLLGGAWLTLEGVARLWRQAGQPRQLEIVDVGAGSGDASRLLLRWATLRRITMKITLIDIHPETCVVAEAYYQDEPRVRVEQGDVFLLPPRCTDIVTASLFAHHFPDEQLPALFRTMAEAAQIGLVVNDLHRHTAAWASIWLLTHLFSRNRMIRHDASLSVRRGFRAADFERLRGEYGLGELHYIWRPMFRYLVTVPGYRLRQRSSGDALE